jgi:predicted transcriptional regulator
MPRRLLLSLRPKFAQLILAGEKTVELRRVRPKIGHGDIMFIYATAPIQAVVAHCRVDRVVSDSQDSVWSLVAHRAAIDPIAFKRYYAGLGIAHAIFFFEVVPLAEPISLDALRRGWPEFTPPQSYRYVPSDKTTVLGL